MSVLVTGAGSGIGQAIGQALRASGIDVVGWDLRQSDSTVAVDITDRAAVNRALDHIQNLRAVVHCAGIGSRGRFAELSLEDLSEVVRVNLLGAMTIAHAVHSRLAAGGVLVLFGSVAGTIPMADRAAYCASKAGVAMLAKVLASEWSDEGVQVFCVSPGFVDTGMATRGINNGGTDASRILERTPTGSLVPVAHVVRLVELAISGALPGIVGGELVVDNGYSIGTKL